MHDCYRVGAVAKHYLSNPFLRLSQCFKAAFPCDGLSLQEPPDEEKAQLAAGAVELMRVRVQIPYQGIVSGSCSILVKGLPGCI